MFELVTSCVKQRKKSEVPKPGHLSNVERKLPKWAWKRIYVLKVWKRRESWGLRQELELDM
jgi:hypothetical protein